MRIINIQIKPWLTMRITNIMWPFIKDLMITIQSQDYDNDGLIDSEGFPDQVVITMYLDYFKILTKLYLSWYL